MNYQSPLFELNTEQSSPTTAQAPLSEPIPVISMYSGGGFLDIGFAREGFYSVWANELVPEYARAYNEAAGAYLISSGREHTEIAEPCDIRTVSPSYIESRAESATLLRDAERSYRGVIGGPPCQDFSIGGKNSGAQGERGSLVYDFLDKIAFLKPEFFLFENVKGFYQTKKHRLVFDDLVLAFRERGYKVFFKLINALDFGIPQDRERIFIVGFRDDIFSLASRVVETPFSWPNPIYSKSPKSLPWPTKWTFGTSEPYHDALPRELMVATAFTGVENLPNQSDAFVPKSKKFREIREGDTDRKSFKRLHRFRYSPTVAYGNNEVHLHPTEPRRISVREALRLQTVPDAYVFKDMTLTDMFKITSNGVPVKLAEVLALSIKQFLIHYECAKVE